MWLADFSLPSYLAGSCNLIFEGTRKERSSNGYLVRLARQTKRSIGSHLVGEIQPITHLSIWCRCTCPVVLSSSGGYVLTEEKT